MFLVNYTSRNKTRVINTASPNATLTELTPGYNFTVTVEAYVNNGTLVARSNLSVAQTGKCRFEVFRGLFLLRTNGFH